MSHRILAIDDETKNLKLIQGFLGKDYDVVTAEDGVQGWTVLEESHKDIDVILLDRMMPNMDGMALMAKLKEHPEMKQIPVIMQTAAAQKQQVAEGIKAGVYYYLTKPYDAGVLHSIVEAALRDSQDSRSLRAEVKKYKSILSLVDHCKFSLCTLDEVRDLTVYLANFFPDPDRVSIGIAEMLLNALEHGNLKIGYDEKTRLNNQGCWREEILRRQALPENIGKRIEVSYSKSNEHISLTVKDEGDGFDWSGYMEMSPDRVTHNHGRGIAMSNLLSFDAMEYKGDGNEVECIVNLSAQAVA